MSVQPPIPLKTCRLLEETSFPHVPASDGNELKMQGLRETSFFGFCAPGRRTSPAFLVGFYPGTRNRSAFAAPSKAKNKRK